jgi:hypothetical protein
VGGRGEGRSDVDQRLAEVDDYVSSSNRNLAREIDELR